MWGHSENYENIQRILFQGLQIATFTKSIRSTLMRKMLHGRTVRNFSYSSPLQVRANGRQAVTCLTCWKQWEQWYDPKEAGSRYLCWNWKWKLISCPTLCDPINYTVHEILQAWGNSLKWVAFPFSRDLPNTRIKHRSPTLQADSLPVVPPGKPKNTGVGSLSLLQQISPTPGIKPGPPALQVDSLPTELPGKKSGGCNDHNHRQIREAPLAKGT